MGVARGDDVDEGEELGARDEARDRSERAPASPISSRRGTGRAGCSRPPTWTRKPLWPSHQMWIPVSSRDAVTSATKSSPRAAARRARAAPRRRSPRPRVPAPSPSGTGTERAARVRTPTAGPCGSSRRRGRARRGRRPWLLGRRALATVRAGGRVGGHYARRHGGALPRPGRCGPRARAGCSSTSTSQMRSSSASRAAASRSRPRSRAPSRCRSTRSPSARSGYPRQPEYGIGAVAPGPGGVYLRTDEGLGEEELREVVDAGRRGGRDARPRAPRGASADRPHGQDGRARRRRARDGRDDGRGRPLGARRRGATRRRRGARRRHADRRAAARRGGRGRLPRTSGSGSALSGSGTPPSTSSATAT